MRRRLPICAFVTCVAGVFPATALADFTETTILAPNTTLHLDTGAVSTSGGDLHWSGGALSPVGSATLRSLAHIPPSDIDGLPQSYWAAIATNKTTPIAASDLAPGAGAVVKTNGGNVAALCVMLANNGTLAVYFKTFGANGAANNPQVSGVMNNSSSIPMGYPSYGVAPSSLFVITGSNLADAGNPVLQSTAPPGLPLSLNGASITVVVNGVTTHPAIYYTSPGQIAAVLPAATPVGLGALTVTYLGATSAPSPILVVPSAIGINNYYTRLGVATDATTGKLLTFTDSGLPGEVVVLWATGLGADPADSDTTFATSPHAVNSPLQIYIGGIAPQILYQGSAGYPGVNQINVIIPPTVAPGCLVSVVAVSGGITSNTVTIPVQNGGGECTDPAFGIRGSQIPAQSIITLKTGQVTLLQDTHTTAKGVTTVTNSANAEFEKFTGILSPAALVSAGGCVLQYANPVPVGQISALDSGTVTLTGPAGLNVNLAPQAVQGSFGATLAAGAIPTTGGTFTFTATGGVDVGQSTTALTLANPILAWTNQTVNPTYNRAQGYTMTWTGGNPGTSVEMTGTSTGPLTTLGFTCAEAVEAGQFAIPPYLLNALPAGSGGAGMQSSVLGTLTATGLDATSARAQVSSSVAATFR